ncbi:hypothetical protein J4526_04715 [Desulfurococcaceae archaeon MEX13E-LK6-19]|nr:hypothetical protein J4526_04715 [Desulfurococcaceae archaeon MEX13E-LK6-19]
MTEKKRLLLIPGTSRDSIRELIAFINSLIHVNSRINRIYIVGIKETIEVVGKSLPRDVLREKKVILYRLIEQKDWGAQVLRIFVNTLPDVIVYFLRSMKDDEVFDTKYFYLIGIKGGSKIISYAVDNRHVCLGDKYTSLSELEKAIEEN